MATPNGDRKASVLPLLEELPGVDDVVWATVTRLANARMQTSVLFTAVEKRAGSTVLACATAMGLARHQRASVCLLETNIRHPGLAGYLGLAGAGLSDVLDGHAEIDDCLQEMRDCPGLFVLPAGIPRALVAGEFTTDRMRSIIDRLKQRCNFLVLDAAPVLDHIETRLLLRHVDAVLLVLRAEATRRTDAERTHDILVESGTPILGSIFNAYRTEDVRRWFERAERLYANAVRSALRGNLASVRIDGSPARVGSSSPHPAEDR